MITRKIEKEINDWLDTGEGALFVYGPRQVGKTYMIRKCLKEYAQSSMSAADENITPVSGNGHSDTPEFLEISLSEEPDIIPVLRESGTAEDLLFNLSLARQYAFHSSEAVLFIDDVQNCPEIAEKVIDWINEDVCRFIICGVSFPGVHDQYRRRSVNYLRVYPLDFEEYLLAAGLGQDVINHIRDKFLNYEPLSEAAHKKMMEYFEQYMLVGGMPAAISEYMRSGDPKAVRSVQKEIIELYRRDHAEEEQGDKTLYLSGMYGVIPMELLKKNRRFRYADIDKRLKAGRAENTLKWHEDHGDVICAYHTSMPRAPLIRNIQKNLVKVYYSDTGLLSCVLDESRGADAFISSDMEKSGYTAALYENIAAQELAAHGNILYYYNDHTLGELDFVIESDDDPLPIEVACGKNYYRHSAVKNVTGSWKLRIPRSFVLSDKNMSEKGDIITLPIYMVMFI